MTATRTIDSIGLNTKFDFNDNWSMDADLSWSKVERDDLRLESTAGNGIGERSDAAAADGKRFLHHRVQTASRYLTPTLNYSDYGTVFLTDPGSWGGGPRRSGFVGASGHHRRDRGDPPGGDAQVRRGSS